MYRLVNILLIFFTKKMKTLKLKCKYNQITNICLFLEKVRIWKLRKDFGLTYHQALLLLRS